MNIRKFIMKCEECEGKCAVEYDDDTFIEPEKCPFCGKAVFDIEEEDNA